MAARSITYSPLPKRLDPFKRSASCLPGNLAIKRDSKNECCGYAIAHRSEVILTQWTESGGRPNRQTVIEPFPRSSDIDSLTFITGMKWCELPGSYTVLVITSFAGFVVMNANGTTRLFQYRITHKDNMHVSSCARGITVSGKNLCIGTSEGYTLVFSITKDEGVEFRQQLGSEGDPPISCLAADDDGHIASGNEIGDVVIWRDPSVSRTQEMITQFKTECQTPCTQIQWWRDFVAIGYGNGKMSICSPDRGIKLIDVSAHSQWINGLDIAPKTGLILTLSEDSTYSVWKLSGTSKNPKLSLVYSGLAENCLLTGGLFCDLQGTAFALVAYDSASIVEYGQSLSP